MKQYKVINLEINNKETHDYTITVEMNKNKHKVLTLNRSHDSTWAEDRKGEEVIKLIDTGDEYVFPKKEFAGDAGYDKFAELFILMSFINNTERLPIYKGRIEEIIDAKTFEI